MIYKSTAHIKIPKRPFKPHIMDFFFGMTFCIYGTFKKLFMFHTDHEVLRSLLWLCEETRTVHMN